MSNSLCRRRESLESYSKPHHWRTVQRQYLCNLRWEARLHGTVGDQVYCVDYNHISSICSDESTFFLTNKPLENSHARIEDVPLHASKSGFSQSIATWIWMTGPNKTSSRHTTSNFGYLRPKNGEFAERSITYIKKTASIAWKTHAVTIVYQLISRCILWHYFLYSLNYSDNSFISFIFIRHYLGFISLDGNYCK